MHIHLGRYGFLPVILMFCWCSVSGQENYKTISVDDSTKVYQGGEFYQVNQYDDQFSKKKAPKNVALQFASKNRETLIIVTADHETGGLAVRDGNLKTGMVKGSFSTGSHTGIVVPVFAFGPGAEQFTGFMENTQIADKIWKLMEK
jgi:alkaline phosphatase